MTEEAKRPAGDGEKAGLMMRLVAAALGPDTPGSRAGLGAIMQELREADPEAFNRLATSLQLRHVGRGRTTAH